MGVNRPDSIGEKKQIKYAPVQFNDSQNGKKQTFNVPVGTRIATTSDGYVVKADGIFNNKGEKVENIPVILPQSTALSIFDANKDGKIDDVDAGILEDVNVAASINDKLARNGSSFRIIDTIDDFDGGFADAAVYDQGFYATFSESGMVNGTKKGLTIQTPEQQENIAEQKAAQEGANKPWWKFWELFR